MGIEHHELLIAQRGINSVTALPQQFLRTNPCVPSSDGQHRCAGGQSILNEISNRTSSVLE